MYTNALGTVSVTRGLVKRRIRAPKRGGGGGCAAVLLLEAEGAVDSLGSSKP